MIQKLLKRNPEAILVWSVIASVAGLLLVYGLYSADLI